METEVLVEIDIPQSLPPFPNNVETTDDVPTVDVRSNSTVPIEGVVLVDIEIPQSLPPLPKRREMSEDVLMVNVSESESAGVEGLAER